MSPAVRLTLVVLFITGAAAYTNHTVGGPAGWLFDANTNTSSANYASWAANQSFNLGDYLIFRTNTNQTVVLTYNDTTFRSCSVDNSSDSDTFLYDQGTGKFGQPVTVAVPLTIEGGNYFFSDASDGIQCEHGMAFGINVSHGVGLPPSLNHPPPPPYVELEPPPPDTTAGTQPSGAGLSDGANVRRTVYYALTFYGIFAIFDV